VPYTLFLTMRRSNEFSKAKAVWTGQRGESEPVLAIEEPEFFTVQQCFDQLLTAIRSHMEVRHELQRRDG
jgi:hypothetical protein